MLIRPATPTDIPAMMRLEQHSVTASHWSAEQYDRIFRAPSPRRVALIIEEAAAVRGFLVAQSHRAGMGDRKHCHCGRLAPARPGHAPARRVSGSGPELKAQSVFPRSSRVKPCCSLAL